MNLHNDFIETVDLLWDSLKVYNDQPGFAAAIIQTAAILQQNEILQDGLLAVRIVLMEIRDK